MTSYLPSLTRDNLSLYTVPLAWAIALGPHVYAGNAYKAATGKKMDVRQPRGFTQQVADDPGCDSKTKGRILRAEAAHANSYENLGLFAAGVAAANVAHIDPATLNFLSIGYLVSRLAYNHIYIFQDLVHPAVRSVAYLGSMGLNMALFVVGGNSLRRSIL